MSTPADWAQAMQKAQADLMKQWTQAASGWFPPGATPGATPGAAAGAMPGSGDGTDVARRLIAQFEQYLGVSRSLWELVGKSTVIADPSERLRVFNQGLAGLQQQAASLWNGATPGPFAAMAAAVGAMPGAMGGAVPGAPAGMPPVAWPALGPTREQQERLQKLAQAMARLAQAQLAIGTQWNEIVAQALRTLGATLGPRLQGGNAPASMKELYDQWITTAEASYAQAAHGAAFVTAQSELMNALAEWRVAQRELVEDWARQFDLPTRSELNTVHQQLRELRAALQRMGGI